MYLPKQEVASTYAYLSLLLGKQHLIEGINTLGRTENQMGIQSISVSYAIQLCTALLRTPETQG